MNPETVSLHPREALLRAGLDAFDGAGFDRATVASIRRIAGVSNGSFFHFFGSKDGLAAALFLQVIRGYHAALLKVLAPRPDAPEGIAALVHAHLDWVVNCRREARFLFEQSRAEWLAHIREEQHAQNTVLRDGVEAWRVPLVASGALRPLPAAVLIAEVIGPAQIFCRAWLAGRDPVDPREHADALADCAVRAVVEERKP